MDVFLNQFQAGTVAFTTVVIAEVALLADEEAELTARQNLFLASVSLIEALGGGWDTTLVADPGAIAEGLLVLPEARTDPAGSVGSAARRCGDADRAGRVATGTIAAESRTSANRVANSTDRFGPPVPPGRSHIAACMAMGSAHNVKLLI